jgi:hypothetical protein
MSKEERGKHICRIDADLTENLGSHYEGPRLEYELGYGNMSGFALF